MSLAEVLNLCRDSERTRDDEECGPQSQYRVSFPPSPSIHPGFPRLQQGGGAIR